MQLISPQSGFFHSQRLKLHYAAWGNPELPKLLLIHGGRDHCRNWDWVANALCHDWHVIAPDLRGHGDSQWVNSGTYTYDDYLCDLHGLVEHLQVDKVSIIGHSLGGNIALRFAAAFAQRIHKLVCVEGFGIAPADVERVFSKDYGQHLHDNTLYRQKLVQRTPHRYATQAQALAHFHSRNPTLTLEQASHLTRHGLRTKADGSLSWKFDEPSREPSQLCASEDQLRQLIRQVCCPVLLPWGGKSFFRLADNQQRIQHFTNARVQLYPDAGHWPHHDALDNFVEDVRRFLQEP